MWRGGHDRGSVLIIMVCMVIFFFFPSSDQDSMASAHISRRLSAFNKWMYIFYDGCLYCMCVLSG